ncbi:hypothetical protein AeRB84_007273 [Aphanomyces euteiches]|nr:hypothetical protein AeRB84_007273 [Aphanomyces euteiches]
MYPQVFAFVGQHLDDLLKKRLRRISLAQDEEVRWADIKAVLRDRADHLPRKRFRDAARVAWQYEIGDENALYRTAWKNKSVDPTVQWQIVVPQSLTTMVLGICHGDVQGGHLKLDKTYNRLRRDYYWVAMYADAKNFIECCPDCNTSGPPPRIKARSPGNLTPEYPMHIVGMDFAVDLPKSTRGNTVLVVFLDWYTAFIMVKAIPRRDAFTTAQAFEEQVFRRLGACTQVRHDRDPAFMGKVFKAFNQMLGQVQMPTFSYRPQANGATERIIQTLIRAIKAYSTGNDNLDWDDHAERLVMALNTSVCSTRKETPFFLMHGWDPQTTLTATLPIMTAKDAISAWQWRREVQKQYLYCRDLAKDIIKAAQDSRADAHNHKLPQDIDERLHVEDAVWIYIDKVKANVKRKLAHLWHGPFRILSKPNAYSSELELVAQSGGRNYRFHAIVHDSRLKLRRRFQQRPLQKIELPSEAGEFVDFNEEFGLPYDSFVEQWRDPRIPHEQPVSAIRDVRQSATHHGHQQYEYEVRFQGHDFWVWVPRNLLPASEKIYEFDRQRKGLNRLADAIEDDFNSSIQSKRRQNTLPGVEEEYNSSDDEPNDLFEDEE